MNSDQLSSMLPSPAPLISNHLYSLLPPPAPLISNHFSSMLLLPPPPPIPFVALSLSFPSPPWTKLNKCPATGCFVYFHHYSTYINKTNSIYAYLISDTPEQLKPLCDCTYHYRNRINQTLLHVFSAFDSVNCLRFLLYGGFGMEPPEIEFVDEYKRTALHQDRLNTIWGLRQ